MLSHLSLLLNDGVSPDQLSIFVLNLFRVCLYRRILDNNELTVVFIVVVAVIRNLIITLHVHTFLTG